MKIKTFNNFWHCIKLLERMKDDYLFIRFRALEFQKNHPDGVELPISTEYCDECIELIDTFIKSYLRKIERS